jgi:hypothetical protein
MPAGLNRCRSNRLGRPSPTQFVILTVATSICKLLGRMRIWAVNRTYSGDGVSLYDIALIGGGIRTPWPGGC